MLLERVASLQEIAEQFRAALAIRAGASKCSAPIPLRIEVPSGRGHFALQPMEANEEEAIGTLTLRCKIFRDDRAGGELVLKVRKDNLRNVTVFQCRRETLASNYPGAFTPFQDRFRSPEKADLHLLVIHGEKGTQFFSPCTSAGIAVLHCTAPGEKPFTVSSATAHWTYTIDLTGSSPKVELSHTG
jgi:hypothetical protein